MKMCIRDRAKPGSVTCHRKFTAQVYVLTQDEGGRHTPFFNNYRPQFYFRTTDVTGVCDLPEGIEMCMPGDNVEMTVALIHPVAMEEGLRFAIREGGRTVAVSYTHLDVYKRQALKEKKVNADTEIICVGFDYRMDVLH